MARKLDVHWWLSELYRRKAGVDAVDVASLRKSRAEVETVMDIAQGRPEVERQLHRELFVRSYLLSNAGQLVQAYEDLEAALNYFRKTEDNVMALQAAKELLHLWLK